MRVSQAPADYTERDRLVHAHIDLVKATAHRLAQRLPPQVEVSELISVGVLGLIDAAGRYRASLGVPFDAYARRRVHGAMLDALRGMDWAPRSLRKVRRDLDQAMARLRHELRREPTESEIARALNLSEADYARTLEQLRSIEVGVVKPIDDAGRSGTSVLDLCLDPDEGPEMRLQRAELAVHLAKAIEQLPARERHILAMYFQEEMTLAEIGAVIGVGESRVSQLRTQAIARLRSLLREALRLDGRAA